MDNIIKFPKEKLNSPPQSIEETVQKIISNRVNYSISFAEDVVDVLVSIFATDNIDITHESLYNEFELLKDAIFSIHLKSNGISHDLQDVAEDIYGVVEESVEDLLEENT